jgi:hypothetical protein
MTLVVTVIIKHRCNVVSMNVISKVFMSIVIVPTTLVQQTFTPWSTQTSMVSL